MEHLHKITVRDITGVPTELTAVPTLPASHSAPQTGMRHHREEEMQKRFKAHTACKSMTLSKPFFLPLFL